MHRRTVRQALASAVPPPRKAYPRRPRPAIGPYAAVIDGWLVADREVPPKQRHTARRVWQRLVAEHGAGLAEVTVSRYVARRRAELGLDNVQVTVPQAHAPGAEAEVDFGEFHAQVAGVLVKLWLFVMRLSCSGRAFHVAFATQAQEAFLEGHVLALEYFGAVPGRVRYDNLGPAVVRAARELKLPTVRDQAARLAETAARERPTHLAYLAEVLAAELDDRSARRRARRIADARFPRLKRLAHFSTDAVPAITPALLARLAAGTYLDKGEPVVLLGDSSHG